MQPRAGPESVLVYSSDVAENDDDDSREGWGGGGVGGGRSGPALSERRGLLDAVKADP